jgi:hypothetical protein
MSGKEREEKLAMVAYGFQFQLYAVQLQHSNRTADVPYPSGALPTFSRRKSGHTQDQPCVYVLEPTWAGHTASGRRKRMSGGESA